MAWSVRQFWLFSCYGVFRFIKLIFAIFCRIDDFISRKKLMNYTFPILLPQINKRTLLEWTPDLAIVEDLFALKSSAFSMHIFVQISSPVTSFFKKSFSCRWKRKWHAVRKVSFNSETAKPKLYIRFTSKLVKRWLYTVSLEILAASTISGTLYRGFSANIALMKSVFVAAGRLSSLKWELPPLNLLNQLRM